ncbi:MAG: MarR family transcriptional regulator [Deltaproteobacteria bacterium]|nr:MAG: MarR family transcriptional regulator [Deltaproteobacteria bacterium]
MVEEGAGKRALATLARIGARLDERERSVARDHQLTAPQVRALRLLADGCASPVALAKSMGLRPSTITGIVDRLERDGLLRRERVEADRRKVTLVLTQDGLERARALPPSVASELGPSLEGSLDAGSLAELLERVEGLLA